MNNEHHICFGAMSGGACNVSFFYNIIKMILIILNNFRETQEQHSCLIMFKLALLHLLQTDVELQTKNIQMYILVCLPIIIGLMI